jgi:hypothetical protein
LVPLYVRKVLQILNHYPDRDLGEERIKNPKNALRMLFVSWSPGKQADRSAIIMNGLDRLSGGRYGRRLCWMIARTGLSQGRSKL